MYHHIPLITVKTSNSFKRHVVTDIDINKDKYHVILILLTL